jgi:hypothetical protein
MPIFTRLPLAIALLILGVWWCKEVFERLPNDLQILRESRATSEKAWVVTIWAITAFILAGIAYFAWYVAARLFRVFEI